VIVPALGTIAPAMRRQRGALARAVGAEHQRDLAGLERERQAVDGGALAVMDRELVDLGDHHV